MDNGNFADIFHAKRNCQCTKKPEWEKPEWKTPRDLRERDISNRP